MSWNIRLTFPVLTSLSGVTPKQVYPPSPYLWPDRQADLEAGNSLVSPWPRKPPLLPSTPPALPHLTSLFVLLLEKQQHHSGFKPACFFFWLTGCFQWTGEIQCIRPRQLCRRRLQFTAELRCTSRGNADQVTRITNIVDFSLGLTAAVWVTGWERRYKNVYLTETTLQQTGNCSDKLTNTVKCPSLALCAGLSAVCGHSNEVESIPFHTGRQDSKGVFPSLSLKTHIQTNNEQRPLFCVYI